ncbi:hypothetical protein GPECTOR_120g416 [Gonium pectorale]|uniref:O-fucosyltransferase family protein n=1 Tax=Gonium pectorale TaxID=33097 RepID=A0A150FYT8_GONPE|nr:hypothetical protein GPECTOR_120g416 [Gonium pectorale]|eukprot:KXZ42749.1 hypothetical protein GPECTOR_120g416 [Gonium pectorale]
MAKRLNRAAVLPVLIDDGLQRTDTNVLASDTNQVPFSDMYDVEHFRRTMAAAGVRILLPDEAPDPNNYQDVHLGRIRGHLLDELRNVYGSVRDLAVDCPLFKIPAREFVPEDESLAWAALDGMKPNKEAEELINQIVRAIGNFTQKADPGLQGQTGVEAAAARRSLASDQAAAATGAPLPGDFDYIHLRIENDWIEHCKRWESIRDGVVRDNCYRHTDEVDVELGMFGFMKNIPLYVASYWDDVAPERKDKMLGRLLAAGYRVVTSADVFPVQRPEDVLNGLVDVLSDKGREYRAMIEYFLGMRSNRFIGNSVSTFAALGLMERRHRGKWAAYYNGGNIPLASVLPLLHRLPWVFTYNSWSPAYDYMLKGAVRSAQVTRSYVPYCIFMGNSSTFIHQWLVRNNVTIIRHEPKWRSQLLAVAGKAQNNVHHSHLYKTPDTLVSTFQRVDLPVVPVLDQYTYVLYTDADVYFRRPMVLDDFVITYNAGVFVANLPAMRRNYDAFIAMMLDNDNGLYYPHYGPADQGVLNKFYERDLRARMLSQIFNAKPYNSFDPHAVIVHFHGPKPHEYINFLQNGQCEFKNLCEKGFMTSLCKYAPEWVRYVSDEPIAIRLADSCALLENPMVKRLRGGGRRALAAAREVQAVEPEGGPVLAP